MVDRSALKMFVNLVAAYLTEYFPEEFYPSLKPIDSANCIECRNMEYDFIIVGAGSAGSVLAHRLSENPNWNILLIEAGGDESFLTDTPAFDNLPFFTKYDWNYTTVRQKRACLNYDGYCLCTRGHVMGGSSAINGMMYVRGNPADFDEWEQMGNPGWGYKDVLKYFLKMENMTIPEFEHSPLHSTRGPQTVAYSRYYPSVYRDLLQAGIDFGLNVVDYNGLTQVGINYIQTTTDGVTRASTSKCYLNPIRFRPNLLIFKNTLVTKILIDEKNRTATGVQCITSGKSYIVRAKKEIIISAGAINTPKLLMLSGIGPKEHLEEHKIKVIANLPVGKMLQDHALVILNYKQDHFTEECTKQYGKEVAYNYARNRQGELTTNALSMTAFLNNSNLPPNIQIIFIATSFTFHFIPDACLAVGVANLKPRSRGTVKLKSNNPLDAPLIDPNYYDVEEDLNVTMSGIKQAFKYLQMPILSKYGFKLTVNKSCVGIHDENGYLKCIISQDTQTYYDPVGTTRMGSILDKTTVVNPEMKVHTINNLRVVDAGIMPNITRGNTNAPTIMIAEKASDIIKNAYFP